MRRSIGLVGGACLATMLVGCVSVSNPRPLASPGCTAPPAPSIGTPSDLDFALDFSVGVERLEPVDVALETASRDLLVGRPTLRSWLVDHGLTRNEVHVEQRRSGATGIPNLSVVALWIEGAPEAAMSLAAETYALLTLSADEVAAMPEDKPAAQAATVAGRVVTVTHWGTARLAWFAQGEVVYVVLAANEELLTQAVRALPAPPRPQATTGCSDDGAANVRAASA